MPPTPLIPGAVEGRGESLGAVNRYNLLVPVCLLGILAANAYSLLITNHGLLLAHVFPSLRVLAHTVPEPLATFVFATVLQLGIMLLYFTLAVGPARLKLGLLPFLATMVAVSFYFGFISVHANSRADAYRSGLEQRVVQLESRVLGETRYMAASVRESLAGYRRLAEAARRGEDKTGIARCGPLCQGYFDRVEEITSRYGHLLTPVEPAQAASTPHARWQQVSGLHAEYERRAAAYRRFLAQEGIEPADGPAIALAAEHLALRGVFENGDDDPLMLTANSLGRVARDHSVAISALISILPDIINLALALAISGLLALSRAGIRNRRRLRARPPALGWTPSPAPERGGQVPMGNLAKLET